MRWSSRELSELQAKYRLDDEDHRETDPLNMSASERSAYLRGAMDTAKARPEQKRKR